MSKKKTVMIIFVIALTFMAGICLMLPSKKQTGNSGTDEKETEQNLPEEMVTSDSIDTVLTGFAKVIYEYDTRERKFYEGAAIYMTEKAYQDFVPLTEDDGELPEEPVVVESMLKNVQFYYRYIDSNNTEVLMETLFSLSKSGNGQITQYMKLLVTQEENEYKIAECQIVDTLEQ